MDDSGAPLQRGSWYDWRRRGMAVAGAVPDTMRSMTTTKPAAQPAPAIESIDSLRRRAVGAVADAWRRAIASGQLPELPADQAGDVQVEGERPANAEYGDLAATRCRRLPTPQ